MTVSTLIRWTEEEWGEIARELCTKQGGEPTCALDVQKVKARDVFVAQEVLSEGRHRNLASIAQGFAGIRARLVALTQRVPDGEQVTACAETTEVGPERRAASDTAASVSLASEQDLEASDKAAESDGLAEEQAANREVLSERQGSRSMHQASEGSDRSQQHVHIPSLMEAMRPFMVMVGEEIAKAFVKVIFTRDLKVTFPAPSSQARSRAVFSREEALQGPMFEVEQSNPSPDNISHKYCLVDEADMGRVDVDFAPQAQGDESDVLDVQPLFDPKLPPSADSDFKPKIGLVSTPGSDMEGLRQRYPQLHLTIVQAEGLSDVNRFGHCQRIIALCNEISPGTDALLSHQLRHRYIRLNGDMNAVKAQLDAWLASPGSIASRSRRRTPFGGMKGKTAFGNKRQSRYPKWAGDVG